MANFAQNSARAEYLHV